MEIEIESKKNNPLLKRTEVQFIIRHEGKGTPDRDLIRNELADTLNTKKENIIVHAIHSSFGTQESTGYAKVYTSTEKAKEWERDYILKRNKIGAPAKKEEKKAEEPAAPKEEKSEEKPAESTEKQPDESPAEETKEETGTDPTESEEQPAEPANEEVTAPEKTEEKNEEDKPQPDVAEKPEKKETKPPAEEKKE